MEAVILAGGFGTRLRESVPDLPKPLAPVNGVPFLDYQLDWLADGGIGRTIITTHYKSEHFFEYAATRQNRPMNIEIVYEDPPLGTGGAVKHAISEAEINDPMIVLNGDTLFRFPLTGLIDAHRFSGHSITMALAKVKDAARFGTVSMQNERIAGFSPADGNRVPGHVSCGAYIIEPRAFSNTPNSVFSMERDFFPGMAKAGEIGAFAIDGDDAFFDIGTTESYAVINAKPSRH